MSTDLKERDYTSFGSVAKVRFRPMCEALGFEQMTATVYYRPRGEVWDYILLETSRHGGNGFEIYFGVRRSKDQQTLLGDFGRKLKRPDGKPTKFNRFTKQDIQNSAAEAQKLFIEQAEPFLARFISHRDEQGQVSIVPFDSMPSKKPSSFISKMFRKNDDK